jgi:hypothetical protein
MSRLEKKNKSANFDEPNYFDFEKICELSFDQ